MDFNSALAHRCVAVGANVLVIHRVANTTFDSDISVRLSARISFWVVPMELSGGQTRYSSQVVCVNIFLAGINGALRGLRKDIPVRRSA